MKNDLSASDSIGLSKDQIIMFDDFFFYAIKFAVIEIVVRDKLSNIK